MAQAIQVWLYDILKIPLTTTERINFHILNDPFDKIEESDNKKYSFRRLSVRVEGIIKILIEQTVYMPEVAVKFLKKVFREGGYIPSDFWKTDEKETLCNFNDERCMFCVSYFILAKLTLLEELILQKGINKASKLVASVLYHIYREFIIDDYSEILISEASDNSSSNSTGDEFLTNQLFSKNEFKYIYEYQSEWILEVRDKLQKWLHVICILIKTNKYDQYRAHDQTLVKIE